MEASAVSRLAAATSLVAWAEREGTLDAVLDVGPSTAADGDLGLFAQRDLPADAPLICIPIEHALSPEAALADPEIGAPLRTLSARLDDHQRVMLLLLHRRRLSDASPSKEYVEALPSAEALVPTLPLHWADGERDVWLRGTPLLAQARRAAAELRAFHADLVQHSLHEVHESLHVVVARHLRRDEL